MKVYFAASILGRIRQEESAKWQNQIVLELKNCGHEVWDGNLKTEPTLLFEESEKEYLKVFKRNTNIIKKSDFVVAEVSLSDSGVGYEIAYALDNKKPVLALYNEKSVEPTAPPIAASKNKLLQFRKYNTNQLSSIIKDFSKEVKNKLDTKFILIISPEIDSYLNWRSDTKRMHKAQTVREAVQEMMEKDVEYQEYLADEIK